MTAVEWLAEEIELRYGLTPTLILLIRNAKEKEKQQIIDAFLKHRDSKFIHDQKINWQKSAEQYYNEKFENK